MYHSQVNVRYARSLFLLAKEKNILTEVRKDIDIVYKTFIDEEEFNVLLEHPAVKTSKKAEIISEIFKGKLNSYTVSFLLLIVKNKREKHLKGICKHFIEIYRKDKGIKTAVLTTAYTLTDSEKGKIRIAIELKFNTSVEMHEKIDENLIGGMIIQVDDMQLDLSVAKQINQLKDKYINIDFNDNKK